MATETDNLPGTDFAGCRIIAKVGQGGMASVYTGRHLALDKTVAVKILSPYLAREERNVDFFLREARSAAKLEHPNIVQVYNFGKENGSYFIIMPYIEGKSLSDIIAEKGAMSAETATAIILEVLDGLAHAHSKTIIHRDIKPSNILLSSDGHPKIVDFGLARSINEEKQLTMAGEMIGTAYFMSPEQGLAGKVDHRADLYSTGATYFYLLTAKYPFDGKSSMEVIHKHISEPFPNIVLLKPDLPLWISRVLEQLMRKKPEDRYQSAPQLIEEIKRLSAAEHDGTAVSNERSIELPGLSAHLAGQAAAAAAAAAPSREPDYAPFKPIEAPLSSDHLKPAQPRPPAPAVAAAPVGAPSAPRMETLKTRKLQLPELHNTIKTSMHAAIAFTGMGFFMLAGSAGVPKPTIPASLLSPFSGSPIGASIFFAAGIGLAVWAALLKPLKFTPMYTFFSAATGLAAYTGTVYAPSPETPDMVSKSFFCLKLAAVNLFSSSNLLIYSMLLLLAASKFVFKPHWAAKAGSVTAYGLSLLLTYAYFKDGQPISPDTTFLTLAGAAALAGLAAALVRGASPVFSPPLLFLAANALTFVMFTNPQISAITEMTVSAENLRVEGLRREELRRYTVELAAQERAMPEFDIDGRLIEKKTAAKPVEPVQQSREALGRAARLEYYKLLATRLKDNFINTAGLIFIAFFMLLITNVYFVEETVSFHEEQDLLRERG